MEILFVMLRMVCVFPAEIKKNAGLILDGKEATSELLCVLFVFFLCFCVLVFFTYDVPTIPDSTVNASNKQ